MLNFGHRHPDLVQEYDIYKHPHKIETLSHFLFFLFFKEKNNKKKNMRYDFEVFTMVLVQVLLHPRPTILPNATHCKKQNPNHKQSIVSFVKVFVNVTSITLHWKILNKAMSSIPSVKKSCHVIVTSTKQPLANLFLLPQSPIYPLCIIFPRQVTNQVQYIRSMP